MIVHTIIINTNTYNTMINNLLVKYLLLFHQPSGKPGGGRISFMVLLGYHLITKITEYRYRNAMEARVKQLEELSQKGKGPAEEDVITQTEIDRLRESSNVQDMQGLDDAPLRGPLSRPVNLILWRKMLTHT